MTLHTPNYYTAFRCLADQCPHTCCQGWEVPIDRDTAQYYRTLEGSFGERLRRALTVDDEGEAAFRLEGGYCPFLNGQKLCDIHIRLGEERTCAICRSHPRFSYDYGSLNEVGLCASCCEAARLILETDMTLTAAQKDLTGEEAPGLLKPLLTARETALSLLTVEEATLAQRLQALLLFANEVQVFLDDGREEDIPRLCEVYREDFPLLEPGVLPPRGPVLEAVLDALSRLTILQPRWKDLLTAARTHPAARLDGTQGRRAGAYFLYRHWLRGVWDGDVLTWAEFAVLGVAVSALLAPLQEEGFPGALRLFCLELEHNQGNLDALQDALCGQFSLADLLALAEV